MLLAAVAVALLTPPAAAGAASDPLAAAVARVTAAQTGRQPRDRRATTPRRPRYYQLQDEQASTQRRIATLTAQQQHLATLGRLRAVVAYKRGSLVIDDVLGNGSDILDAARRATMLNDVNARGNETIAQPRPR